MIQEIFRNIGLILLVVGSVAVVLPWIVIIGGPRLKLAKMFRTRGPRKFANSNEVNLKYGCPDCGTEEFEEGPSGGASVNVRCPKCKSKFNYCEITGFAERI